MTDTIKTMELVYADLLTPSQLMEDDLVDIEGSIVDVISIASAVSTSAFISSISFIVSLILLLIIRVCDWLNKP